MQYIISAAFSPILLITELTLNNFRTAGTLMNYLVLAGFKLGHDSQADRGSHKTTTRVQVPYYSLTYKLVKLYKTGHRQK